MLLAGALGRLRKISVATCGLPQHGGTGQEESGRSLSVTLAGPPGLPHAPDASALPSVFTEESELKIPTPRSYYSELVSGDENYVATEVVTSLADSSKSSRSSGSPRTSDCATPREWVLPGQGAQAPLGALTAASPIKEP